MNQKIKTFLLTLIFSGLSQSTKLNICLNRPIIEKNPMLFSKDYQSKEVLFKNIYETLFYYSSSNNKIKANIGSKITKVGANQYLIKIKKNVQFHNNKIFTVKKYVDYKDVIFSLERVKNSKVKVLKLTDQGLRVETKLNLKNLYLELSRPKNIILSRAYWRYLKKKNKEKIFYKRPLGTGPFTLAELTPPYKLKRFKNYHLANRLKSINYSINRKYTPELCDIFWDNNILKKKNYEINLGYSSKSTNYDSLIFIHNSNNNQLVHEVINPLELNKTIFKNLDLKVTTAAIPPMIKKSYLLNKKKIKNLEETNITLSVDDRIYEIFNKKNFDKQLKKYFLKNNIHLTISKEKKNIHITTETNLKNIELLNKNLYCKYKTKACNKTYNIEEIHSILLNEKIIIPLGFYKRFIFFKKNISNIEFNFLDTIDYSEVLLL